jgi:hypothetical protein
VRRFAGLLREFLFSIVAPLVDGLLFFVPFSSRSTNGLEKTDGLEALWFRAFLDVGLATSNSPSLLANLYASEEQENYEDQHDETETAAGIVSPTTAVRPGWQRPESY